MEPKDWINIAAIILGPILAIQVQKIFESFREDRTRKYNLFQTLMVTRGFSTRFSNDHVFALNQIDLEFSTSVNFLGVKKKNRDKYKKVLEAWKIYHHRLNATSSDTQDLASKRDDAFYQLLYEMATSLGYDFDKIYLEIGSYLPMKWADAEAINDQLKIDLLKVLNGEKSLQVVSKNNLSDDPLK